MNPPGRQNGSQQFPGERSRQLEADELAFEVERTSSSSTVNHPRRGAAEKAGEGSASAPSWITRVSSPSVALHGWI